MKKISGKLTHISKLSVVMLCGALVIGCAGTSTKKTVAPDKFKATDNIAKTETIKPITQESVKPEKEPKVVMKETTQESEKFPGIDISEDSQPEVMAFQFGFDKSELGESDVEAIKQHAKFMKDNPGLILKITGHTDHHGPRAYNEYLSKQRAEEVAKVLIAEGVSESQLVINALANEKPLEGETNTRKNRRVELEYNELNLVSTQ